MTAHRRLAVRLVEITLTAGCKSSSEAPSACIISDGVSRGLMEKDEWKNLGLANLSEAKSTPPALSSGNQDSPEAK